MENGTFNRIKKVGNLIIKISKEDETANLLKEEFDSKNIYEYMEDIKKVGIKVPKLYLNFNSSNYSIMIQEFISGKTVQDILEDENILTIQKYKVISDFFKIYQKSKENSNLCLDWNLKNFILKDDIYYIDLVPCLYLDKIKSSKHFKDYAMTYLDENIQLAGILSYMLKSFYKNSDKETLIDIYNELKNIIKNTLNKEIDLSGEHAYLLKLKEYLKYFNEEEKKEEFEKNIRKHSLRR